MHASRTIKVAVLFLVLLLGIVFSLRKAAVTAGSEPNKPPRPAAVSYDLDIVFEGSWAFVVGADGSVTAYTPRVKDHSKPYIRALEEQQLPMGKYTLSVVNQVPPIQTDYDSTAVHNEYKLYYANPIDTKGAEYLSILLPKPTSFVPLHLDSQEFKDTDPGTTPATNPFPYPTIMALRYDLSDIATVNVNCSNNCLKTYTPTIPKLGNEQLLIIEVDPLMPDKPTHDHARAAFHQLISLFPEFTRWVAFPALPSKEKNRNGPGKDCRASLLLLLPKTIQRP
jgi:hypothetical protein